MNAYNIARAIAFVFFAASLPVAFVMGDKNGLIVLSIALLAGAYVMVMDSVRADRQARLNARIDAAISARRFEHVNIRKY